MATSQRIELATFMDGRVEVDVSENDFYTIQAVVRQHAEKPLLELADSEPFTAYQIVRKALTSIVRNSQFTQIGINGNVIADTAANTLPHDMGRMVMTLAERLPDGYGEPFDFSLGTYYSEADQALFGEDGGRIELVAIRVEAPGYAF